MCEGEIVEKKRHCCEKLLEQFSGRENVGALEKLL